MKLITGGIALLLTIILSITNGEITIDDIPSGELHSLVSVSPEPDNSLEGWFEMTRGFVGNVAPESALDVIFEAIDNNDAGDPKEFALTLLKAEAGFAACLIVGLIFIIGIILSGCIFCCCRCCNKCGAKRVQRQTDNIKCRRQTYSVLLFVTLVFIIVAIALSFLCVSRLSESVDESEEILIIVLNDANFFLNNTYNQIHFLGIEGVVNLTEVIKKDLNDIKNKVGIPLKETVRQILSEPFLREVQVISNDAKEMTQIIEKLNPKGKELEKMDLLLVEITNNLNAFVDDCESETKDESLCAELKNVKLSLQPKVKLGVANPGAASQYDIEEKINKVIEGVPNKVEKESAGIRKSIIKSLDDFANSLETSTYNQEALSIVKEATDAIDKVIEYTTEGFESARKYDEIFDKYWALKGLIILILVPILFMFIGLIFGILGSNSNDVPAHRGSLSNCGGNLLILSVYLFFILSALTMLVTTVLFQIGGHIEVYVCKPLFEDNSQTLDKIVELSTKRMRYHYLPSEILKGCKDDQSLIKVSNFTNILNLESHLNFEANFEKLSDIKVPGLDVALPNKNIFQSLLNKLHFEIIETELGKTPNIDDKNEVLTSIDKVLSELVTENKKKALEGIKSRFMEISRKLDSYNVEKESLKIDVTKAKSIKVKIENFLTDNYEKTSVRMKSELPAQIDAVVKAFTENLFTKGNDYQKFVIHSLNNEVAKCGIVWNTYDVLRHLICRGILDPLNGYWFGIGWCIFFEIFAMAFSIKLSKHFLRMNPMQKNVNAVMSMEELYPSRNIAMNGKQSGYPNQGYNEDSRMKGFDQY